MKNKLTQFIPILVMSLAVGFGEFSRWCSAEGHVCYRTVVEQMIPYVTYPLYFFALYSLPLAIVLIFISYPVFRAWWKIAILLLVVAFLFIAGTPVYPSMFSTDRDQEARFIAEAFTALSLIIIVWKYFAVKSNK